MRPSKETSRACISEAGSPRRSPWPASTHSNECSASRASDSTCTGQLYQAAHWKGVQVIRVAIPVERIPGEQEAAVEEIGNAAPRMAGNGNCEHTPSNRPGLIARNNVGGVRCGIAVRLVDPDARARSDGRTDQHQLRRRDG